ncbi:hypothetical protein TTRE_0000756601 [Trichuris trichiura]|uniref:Abnormal cell migration protein 18-like fibronectin type I domain-containing protein n=1 Tax=Trichuris trichiura TaxID=36087 RepID=A0A077ZKW7_TRITR|nr:hypothetical protein TTRE_0000756601 [Trichuris trichiura]
MRSYESCPNLGPVRVMWRHENGKRTKPYGCVLESGEGIPLGATFKTKTHIFRCDQTGEEHVTMTQVQCVLEDNVIDIGDQLPFNGFVYSCTKRSTCIGLKITGCATDNNATIAIGEQFIKDDYVFECFKDDFVSIHKVVACMIDGKKVEPQKTIISGSFWYKCRTVGQTSLQQEKMGCVAEDGKLIDLFQTYRKADFLYGCKKTGTEITIEPVGCVAKEYGIEREFRFGEKWYTPFNGPISYLMECVGEGGHIFQKVSRCVVNEGPDLGRETVEVGCGIRYGHSKIFICRKTEDGGVRGTLETYDTSKSTYEAIKEYNVRMC